MLLEILHIINTTVTLQILIIFRHVNKVLDFFIRVIDDWLKPIQVCLTCFHFNTSFKIPSHYTVFHLYSIHQHFPIKRSSFLSLASWRFSNLNWQCANRDQHNVRKTTNTIIHIWLFIFKTHCWQGRMR